MPLAVDFQGGVTSAWSNVITFVPKLAAALLIILVGYLLAKVVASVLNKVLERVGFDRAVERGGVKQALARSKYDPSDIIAKLAFWLIFLVSLQIAFGVFGPNPISDLLQGLIAYLPNVLVAIVIIVVAAAIAKAVTDLLTNLLSSVSGGQVMAKGAGIAVLVFGAFAALDQLQIAPRIVTGLWYAILAIVVGSAVVAVGGGGIKTMQRYWERATTTAEERAPELTQQVQQSASTSAVTRGTGRRPTPTPGPRSSRPSGPAGCAATARPSRRRDASTGHRVEASRPPSHQPQGSPVCRSTRHRSSRCSASRARTTRLTRPTRSSPTRSTPTSTPACSSGSAWTPTTCWAGSPAAYPEASTALRAAKFLTQPRREARGQARTTASTTTARELPRSKEGSCMSAPSIETAQAWQGRTMVDPAGDKLGTIDAIYLDDETGQPEWATVTSGLFTATTAFVPLAQAQATGDAIQVPYGKDQVKGAPSMEADGQLSQDEEAELYRHYGLDYSEHRSDSGLPAGERDQNDDRVDGRVQDRAVGRDTSGPTTDDAMTRSEEELRVGTQTRERGRARLRKYVTTEQQTVTVPVQREEVRVEREPITDANLDAATSGPAISEEEHEVTLREEEVVVDKRAVPKERVRLDTETVTDERQVAEEVRKEQIEVDDDQERFGGQDRR